MTDEQDAVIIRDNDGNEHEFPSGFDPKRAASIVRERTSKVPTPTTADMLTGRMGRDSNLKEGPAEPNVLDGGLHEMLQSAAHPDSLGGFAGLALPFTAPSFAGAANQYVRLGKAIRSEGTSLKQIPGRMLQVLRERASPTTADADLMLGRGGAPSTPAPPPAPVASRFDPVGAMLTSERPAPSMARGGTTPAPAMPAGAVASESGATQTLGATERAALVQQGYSPEMIARIEQQLQQSTPPIRGTLRMAPTEAPPLKVDAASLPESWKPLAEPSPLQQPRVDIGAEKVGRGEGLTKQQVRDQTAPILGEAQGAASPILPEGALKRIIDAVKALPPGSQDRLDYVARATSGKTQWQVENIRRTLEHLGLIVPVAAAGGDMVREALIQRLNGGSQ